MPLKIYTGKSKKNAGKPPKRDNYERSLQITSKQWFDASLPDVLAFHVSNESFFGEDRERAIIQMSMLKKQGFLPGVSDWLLFWPKRRAAIELKTATGKLSESQERFRDRWTATGGGFAVCRTMEDIDEAVRGWGLVPKYPVPRAYERSKRQMEQYAAFEFFRPLPPLGEDDGR